MSTKMLPDWGTQVSHNARGTITSCKRSDASMIAPTCGVTALPLDVVIGIFVPIVQPLSVAAVLLITIWFASKSVSDP